ncbi:hypothetical protein BDV3_004707 [Batrachochytrium dendrobatidis]
MRTDRSVQFSTLVQTLRKQTLENKDSSDGSHVLRPFKPKHASDPFLQQANKILSHISRLNHYILTIRKPYLQLGNMASVASFEHALHAQEHPSSTMLPTATPMEVSLMTDEKKDVLDMQIQAIIKGCLTMIQALSKLIDANAMNDKTDEKTGFLNMFETRTKLAGTIHLKSMRESVVWILEHRLMSTSNIQQAMQEYRLERSIRHQESYLRQDLSHLKVLLPKSPDRTTEARSSSLSRFVPNAVKARVGRFKNNRLDSSGSGRESLIQSDPILTDSSPQNTSPQHSSTTNTTPFKFDFPVDPYASNSMDEDESQMTFTVGERAALEQDNSTMMDQLESTLTQVRTATQSLNEIAQLQSTLAHHLQAQSETIDSIYDDAEKANQTIAKGNDNLKSAQKYFGGPRWWVLYVLLTISGLLLLLDSFF